VTAWLKREDSDIDVIVIADDFKAMNLREQFELPGIAVLFSELIRPNLPDYNNPFTFVRPL
jgi:predicted nucleotidyltransferase